MNKFVIILGLAVGVAVSVPFLIAGDNAAEPIPVYETGFTYYDIETIQNNLKKQNIFVSAPTAITDHTIKEYCILFENGLPRTVEYCTTTAVADSMGNTLGNINIGGDAVSPIMAIANLETSSLESNQDAVFAVFEVMIETLVCDCWEEEQSEDYETLSSWLTAVHDFHRNSDGRNIKSHIENLGD